MSRKNDQNAEIVTLKNSPDYAAVHDGIIRIGYMFDTMRPLTLDEIDRLCENGFTSYGRFTILSQLLFPSLCSMIGRGLTLEEMHLLTGLDMARTKRALAYLMKMGLPSIEVLKADKDRFVKVMVPLKVSVPSEKGADETISKEPILAPKESIQNIKRNGYTTKDGRSLRYDYLSFVPGPMPTVYLFKSGKDLAEELVGDIPLENFETRFIEDQGAMGASQDIAIAQLRMVKSILEGEHAAAFIMRIQELFFDIGGSAHHFAIRYRALNDLETYEVVERLSESYLYLARSLDSGLTDGTESCKEVGILIGETIEKLSEDTDE